MSIGIGSEKTHLNITEIEQICREAFNDTGWDNKRILAIIPDHTRSGPVGLIFKVIVKILDQIAAKLDFLIALGTHPPMSTEAIFKRIDITAEEKDKIYKHITVFNHDWQNPDQLAKIGAISADQVAELSQGLLQEKVDITINKLIFNYDRIVIIGPTFPHEVVGFSGGNKYLFPGIAGREIIDMFHWLGALITNPRIIGRKDTPVRKVVDLAAEMIPIEKYCLSMVVSDHKLNGLFFGTPEEAWSAAADLSDKLHIIYKEKPFKQVLSCAPPMYDDLWTGGKCMYKLEPVVDDDGELIIYAPHINQVSVTHGRIIEQIGYHTRDYFIKQWDKYQHIPGGVMAHSTHVKGIGTYENGQEKPRIKVTLATGIAQDICKKINLGYMNPAEINSEQWMNRENEGILYVPKAGEMLYRLREDPFSWNEEG